MRRQATSRALPPRPRLRRPVLVRVALACAVATLAGPTPCGAGQVAGLAAEASTAIVAACVEGRAVYGRVTDQSGAALPGARVAVTAASGVLLDEGSTAADGAFHLCAPAIDVVVTVRVDGFRVWQRVVAGGWRQNAGLAVVLAMPGFGESITVTPVRGEVRSTRWTPEFVTSIGRDALDARAGELLALRLRVDAGLHVQQTSTSQTSPYVRGLTGQQVVTLVDGVRFNTAVLRPGANQYTALLDAVVAERVEVVHGPNATQYGTDSLGGTINLITPAADGWRARRAGGQVGLTATSADRGAGGSVTGGWSTSRVTAFGHVSARSADDLRAGGARDSHSVVTRLFGLPSSLLGDRLAATGYRQAGASAKAIVRAGGHHVMTASYLGGHQAGASRYDMLDGGAGHLRHFFDPQDLVLGWVRYDGVDLGAVSTLSVTASYNAQRDDREYQNVNNSRSGLASDVTREWNRVAAAGTQVVAGLNPHPRHSLRGGADVYLERVDARREDRAPVDGAPARIARARLPDGARYTSVGAFLQDVIDVQPDRVQAQVALRYSRFAYRQRAADNPQGPSGPLAPDFSTTFDDLTGNVGVVVALGRGLHLTGSIARGFRAPNMNDFGTIGLSGGGFEISPDEAQAVRANVELPGSGGTTRVPVGTLGPETLRSYDLGLRLQTSHLSAGVAVYQADVRGTIERRTALLPPGAAGMLVGGQLVLRQDASGAIYTPASSSAVFVRVNGADMRLRGIEASLAGHAGSQVSWSCQVSSLRGESLVDGSPPPVENGLPPARGSASVRWSTPAARLWIDGSLVWAATQTRLSSNDLRQARIGGLRTREEIRDFFQNGAVARGLVANGRLVATGETLSEVIGRVLGDAASAPLFTEQAGFVVWTAGFGWRVSPRLRMTVLVENLLDANYRTMGSGVDGPGRGIVVRQHVTF